MLLFEIVSVIVILIVMAVITKITVEAMQHLTNVGVKFIPASFLSTAWNFLASLSLSVFLVSIIRFVCGV